MDSKFFLTGQDDTGEDFDNGEDKLFLFVLKITMERNDTFGKFKRKIDNQILF